MTTPKVRQYLVRVCQTFLITYEVSATSRKEAAQEVKRLLPHQRNLSYSVVGEARTDRVTSVITKSLLPKAGVYTPKIRRKRKHADGSKKSL